MDLERIDNSEKIEKYILVAVATGDEQAAWNSLEELEELLKTAGAEAVCHVVQNLDHPDRATYVGSGKARELKEMMEMYEADGVITDDELTPSQFRNLSDAINGKVLDRTLLILDIFAAHARTKEGKIQVEIAQLRYRASRLRGMGEAMDRLGGGIGTRGPGESKLETDRRVIQKRVKILSDEIEEMKRTRETTRKRRSSSMVPTVAIVGYTNAGKSTLLNLLTDSDVLSENKLFATLDPTTRTMVLENGQEVLLTDTVGFINKLPHHLVDAFRSTLEEAKYADIILQVIDASDPQHELQHRVLRQTLEDLDVVGKPVITAWNKIDAVEPVISADEETGELISEKPSFRDFEADESVEISAKKNLNIDGLCHAIGSILASSRVEIDTVFPYSDTGKVALIRKYGQLLSEDYEADGIHIHALVPRSLEGQL